LQKVNVVASTTIVLGDLPENSLKACSLAYYLIQNSCAADGLENKSVYGIRVELLEMGKLVEASELKDITSSNEKGKYLLALLSKNAVTPVSLSDVIEDFMAADYDTQYSAVTVETA
jgi:hypothetical protein